MDAMIMVGVNLLLSAALWGIGMLLRRPTNTVQGELKNRQIQISSYGEPLPILYGQCKTALSLVYSSNLLRRDVTTEVGKGGGNTVTQVFYHVDFAGTWGIAPDSTVFGEMCLIKLYFDDKLAYNASGDNEAVKQWKTMAKHFKFYNGTQTLPSPWLEEWLGVGNVPAYKRNVLGVFNYFPVTSYGNRIPTVRAVVAPGTATTPKVYPVTGFTQLEAAGDAVCDVYECGMVLSKDEIWVISAYYYIDGDGDDCVCWRKVSTNNRIVVAETIYEEPDPNCAALEVPFYYCYAFDVDENDFVYVPSCNGYGKIVKLDSDTFTIQVSGPTVPPEIDPPGPDFIKAVRVSRNPVYPYLWLWNNNLESGSEPTGMVYLLRRDTLANPSDSSDFGLQFPCPGSALFPMAADINDSDGSLFVLWGKSSPATYYLSRFYPDGRREDTDIGAWFTIASINTTYGCLSFHADTDQIIIHGDGKLWFVDASAITLNGVTAALGTNQDANWAAFQRGAVGDYFYVCTYAGLIKKIDINTRTVVETLDISADIDTTSYGLLGLLHVSYRDSAYIGARNLAGTLDMQEVMFGRITQGSVYLDDVVSDICLRSGLEAADINVAQLSSDVVKGYCVSQDQSARESIEPLMEAYIFDGVEVDGVLTFVKRGGASVATIPEADLAAHRFGEERPEPLEIEFPDETELPRRLEVHFPDVDRKHESAVQHYVRQITDSKLIKKIQTPILMDADQAKQLAHVAFRYFWTGKPCTLSLGPKYARLMPCDVITIEKSEGDYRVLLLEAQREGLLTNWKGVIESIDYVGADIYQSTITGTPAPTVDDDVFFIGPSIYYLLDLPPLIDAHDQAGVYMASGAMFSDWHGAEVFVSKDTGDTWTYLKSLSSRAKTGVVTVALDDHEYVARDRHSAMTVRWDYTGDTLATVTEAQLLQGQGHYLAVMKTDGDIEIVCARDVTTEADGSQTFENLIRGCKGTEHARTGHVTGEKAVLLEMSTIILATLDATYLNQSYLYNGISSGDSWEDGSQKIFTTGLHTLKPWSGVQPLGSRDVSNNLTITWCRRNRLYGMSELCTGNEIPMSESSESYEIDVYDGTTIVRTITALADETASYTAAQQTADGLTPGDPVVCKIYQLSSVVGRGWPLEATV